MLFKVPVHKSDTLGWQPVLRSPVPLLVFDGFGNETQKSTFLTNMFSIQIFKWTSEHPYRPVISIYACIWVALALIWPLTEPIHEGEVKENHELFQFWLKPPSWHHKVLLNFYWILHYLSFTRVECVCIFFTVSLLFHKLIPLYKIHKNSLFSTWRRASTERRESTVGVFLQKKGKTMFSRVYFWRAAGKFAVQDVFEPNCFHKVHYLKVQAKKMKRDLNKSSGEWKVGLSFLHTDTRNVSRSVTELSTESAVPDT